jgi:hypothetical protein
MLVSLGVLVFALLAAVYVGGQIDLSFIEKDAKKYWRKKSGELHFKKFHFKKLRNKEWLLQGDGGDVESINKNLIGVLSNLRQNRQHPPRPKIN